MESVHGTSKRYRFASEDIISSLPKKVITNIMDRLPIQEAVKTSILSREWRFIWTMLSQLVYDENFFRYIHGKSLGYVRGRSLKNLFYRSYFPIVFIQLRGFITKFVLYMPEEVHKAMGSGFDEQINRWIQLLSKRGMKELVLINMRKAPLKLRVRSSFFQELKHLKLRNCCLHPSAFGFHGFPNLLSLDVDLVTFENFTYGEFMTGCPLLEIVKLNHNTQNGEVKSVEIAKLENLKMLSLSNMAITGSDIFQLMGLFSKLEELDLDFRDSKFSAEAGANNNRVSATLPFLKRLALNGIDFNCRPMFLCACDFIQCSPNLQILKMTGRKCVSALGHGSWAVDWGKLKLQIVELEWIRGMEIEAFFIKSLLAHSFLLKKMVINHKTATLLVDNSTFARKLLKLPRASPNCFINLY